MKSLGIYIACFIVLSIAGTIETYAQFQQQYRYQEELKTAEEGFTVISLKKEGLALIRDMDHYEQGKKRWQLEIVDTTLTIVWSTIMELENRLVLVGYEHSPNHLFLLFREGESDHLGFQLKTVQYKEKSIRTDKIKFEVDFKISHFTMAGSSAVFGGYISNEPAVLLYNQNSDQPKVLPGLFASDIRLLDIRTNQNQSFNVLLTESRGRENKKLIVRTYDHDGNLLIDDIIDVDARFTILNGLTSTLEREEMIIVGTYGEGGNKQALGFFSVVVDPFSEQEITYSDFSSLQHFLDYMPQRRADRIKIKARKEKTVGNVSDYQAYVVPLRIEERSNGFYLLSEMYIPTHNTGPYPYNSNFYNPYSSGYSPYAASPYTNRFYSPYPSYNSQVNYGDFRMIQSMVVKLDAHGKLERDVSLKFDEVRQSNLEQVSDFVIDHDSTFVIYKKEGNIYYLKEAGAGDEQPIINQLKIDLKDQNETLKNEDKDEGATRFWYDNHFYLWGYQTISRKNERHHVFYVNRISIE